MPACSVSHLAVAGCHDGMLHLHGLQDYQRVPFCHHVPITDQHLIMRPPQDLDQTP